MSNELQPLKQMLGDNICKNKFRELLKDKAPGFMTSIISTVGVNSQLTNIAAKNPQSIVRAAAVAASLDLPVDKNFGFAWIIPYGQEAQFQMGYKGYIQLAMRSGQYLKLNVCEVYKNQIQTWNPLTEDLDIDFLAVGEKNVFAYAVYFKLINGFEKTVLFTKDQLLDHAEKYSKSFKRKDGPWVEHEDAMCKKTAIKLVLSKWGVLSIEMQMAQKADHAVIKSDNLNDAEAFEYSDNPDAEKLKTIKPPQKADKPPKKAVKTKTAKTKPEPPKEEPAPVEEAGETQDGAMSFDEYKKRLTAFVEHLASAGDDGAKDQGLEYLNGSFQDVSIGLKSWDKAPPERYVELIERFESVSKDYKYEG